MPAEKIVKDHGNSMDKTVEHLKSEFKSVRTGMASTGLVDSLRVEYYGTPTPVNQMASVVAPDASSIVIKPFDPSSIKDIVKAIQTSDLGLNPAADGKTVRLTIPPLSEERRKQIVTQIKQMGEQSKVSVRNIRRDANKALDDEQKAKTISEDQRDKGKKDIDDVRESPSLELIELLREKGAKVDYNDPYIPRTHKQRDYDLKMKSKPLTASMLKTYDVALIATDHSDYDYKWIVKNSKLVIDTRNATANVKTGRKKIVKSVSVSFFVPFGISAWCLTLRNYSEKPVIGQHG